MGIFINTQQHNRFIYLSLWMNLCCCFVFIKFISSTWHNTQYVYVSTEFEIKTQFHYPGDEWIKWDGRKTIESWIELIEYEIQALFIDANSSTFSVCWEDFLSCHKSKSHESWLLLFHCLHNLTQCHLQFWMRLFGLARTDAGIQFVSLERLRNIASIESLDTVVIRFF